MKLNLLCALSHRFWIVSARIIDAIHICIARPVSTHASFANFYVSSIVWTPLRFWCGTALTIETIHASSALIKSTAQTSVWILHVSARIWTSSKNTIKKKKNIKKSFCKKVLKFDLILVKKTLFMASLWLSAPS